ncbi:MAG: hypothetical protein KBD21_02560 [Candidatus Pacebacteria bacterium]|nr:hypothetical protein [Candidatus Paceibacterota bacterium]
MKTNATVTVKNKQYPYTLLRVGEGVVHMVCRAAKIDQKFLAEDVSELILDLPSLIVAEEAHEHTHDTVIRFRVSGKDKQRIEERAMAKGYDSVSKYLRDVATA